MKVTGFCECIIKGPELDKWVLSEKVTPEQKYQDEQWLNIKMEAALGSREGLLGKGQSSLSGGRAHDMSEEPKQNAAVLAFIKPGINT